MKNPFIWFNSIHPDDVESVYANAIENIRSDRGFEMEYRIKDANGSWCGLKDSFISKVINDDEIIIEGMARDITDNKDIEEKLYSTLHDLSVHKAELQAQNDDLLETQRHNFSKIVLSTNLFDIIIVAATNIYEILPFF